MVRAGEVWFEWFGGEVVMGTNWALRCHLSRQTKPICVVFGMEMRMGRKSKANSAGRWDGCDLGLAIWDCGFQQAGFGIGMWAGDGRAASNKANFRPFWPGNASWAKKQSQFPGREAIGPAGRVRAMRAQIKGCVVAGDGLESRV